MSSKRELFAMFREYITPPGLARSRSIMQKYRLTVAKLLRDQRLPLFAKSIASHRDNCQTVALVFDRREDLRRPQLVL